MERMVTTIQRRRILEALRRRDGQATVLDLINDTKMIRKNILQILKRLVEEGAVEMEVAMGKEWVILTPAGYRALNRWGPAIVL